MHITTPISNPSNIYSVERIHDENVNDTNQIQTTPSGSQYYTLKITPNDYTQLLCAGNFTIDGLSSNWVYNASAHPLHPSKCYPQNPPWYGSSVGQSIKHSTPHSYILKGDGTMGNTFGPPNTPGLNVPCWGPNSQSGQNFTGNGTYRFNGPFVFDNSVYCDGAFRNQFVEVVTWRKIVLVDMYEEDNGNIRSGASGSLDNTENWIQMIWPPPTNNFVTPPIPAYTLNPNHNGYPAYVQAFVFPEYHPELDLEENMNLNLDIDYVLPVQGCTDSGANNYNSLANTNDGSCTYGPPAFTFPPITVSSDITSANHGLYTANGFNGTPLPSPVTILLLEDITFDIPIPTNGTPPYSNYQIEMLNDTVTTSGSPNGTGANNILFVIAFNSTIDPSDPTTYLDMAVTDVQLNSPPGPTFPMDLDNIGTEPGDGVNTFNAGSLTFDASMRVILSVPGTPSSNYSVHDITLQVSATDANGDVVTSSVSIDMAAELGI